MRDREEVIRENLERFINSSRRGVIKEIADSVGTSRTTILKFRQNGYVGPTILDAIEKYLAKEKVIVSFSPGEESVDKRMVKVLTGVQKACKGQKRTELIEECLKLNDESQRLNRELKNLEDRWQDLEKRVLGDE